MKTPKMIRTIAILMTVSALVGMQATLGENSTVALPPELAPMAVKYQANAAALTEARNKAMTQAQQPYLAALTAAAQKAATGNKADEARAVTEEKEAITAGRALAPLASPLLPRELAMPRASLLRETARVERDFAARAQQSSAEYLRGLAFYETKARAAGQADLLKLIEAEKAKIAGQSPGAAGKPGAKTARDLVVNGDFAQKREDGSPESWNSGDRSRGAVTSEQGTTFLRAKSGDKTVTYFLENATRPADAQELEVSVRLRCRDMKGQGNYGVIIAQRDANNAVVSRDVPCILTAPSPAWRPVSGVVKLRPETKSLVIECRILDCAATVDFSNVRVEAR